MAENGFDFEKGKALLEETVLLLFSWIIVLPIGVIVSGKLLSEAFSYKVDSDDIFVINLKVFNIKAEKSEVVTGFGLYMLIFLADLVFFSEFINQVIQKNAGLNISRWNSLCIFSALCAAAVSMMAFMVLVFIPRLLPSRKIITNREEIDIIARIEQNSERKEN